jgi:hypothetical protein
MSLPLQDWQFWIVTLAVAASFAWLLRGVLPVPFLKRRHARRLHQRRVNLTVGGKRPG